MALNSFTAGQPLDVATMNSLVSTINQQEVQIADNAKGKVLKSERYLDTTGRSFGSGWGQGYVSPEFVRSKAGSESRIKMTYRLPARNGSSNWGGGYNELHYSVDGGATWITAGNGGYDAAVMASSANMIASDHGTVWFDDLPGTSFKFRWYHRSYDGTLEINQAHDILHGDNGWGFSNFYIEEISL